MEMSSRQEIVAYLKNNKRLFYEKFGVTRMGIFGSFVRGEQTRSSDIDMVVEIEKNRKNIHSFLQLKRFLERELARTIDLGFEHSLKPTVRDRIKGQITYV
jgi:hypothetical protein